METAVFTRAAVTRIMRFAFKLAFKPATPPSDRRDQIKYRATRLMAAIEDVTSAGDMLTPDLGGSITTKQVTDAVCEVFITANI